LAIVLYDAMVCLLFCTCPCAKWILIGFFLHLLKYFFVVHAFSNICVLFISDFQQSSYSCVSIKVLTSDDVMHLWCND